MDTNGYPTDEELKQIEEWDWHDFKGLLDFIRERWKYADSGYWSQEDNIYSISTAGWSGNEELIAALERNLWFWMFYWESSRRGGHYKFIIGVSEKDRLKNE